LVPSLVAPCTETQAASPTAIRPGGADIVDDGVVENLNGAGVAVDLELADMATIGERICRGFEGSGLVEAAFKIGRQPARLERRAGDFLKADDAVSPAHGKPAIGEIEIRRRHFEQMGGNLLALGDDLVGRHPQRRAADNRRARAGRAHAEGDAVRVAVDVLNFAGLDAEPLVEDLLEGRLVTLALVPMKTIVVPPGLKRISANSRPSDAARSIAKERPMPRNLPRPCASARRTGKSPYCASFSVSSNTSGKAPQS
jgi:hypothetical protein